MAKILIVDDDPTNRLSLSTILSAGGHQVLQADNGEEGLAIIRREAPALAIIDLVMPNMDGLELMQILRGDPAIADTPVILHSAANENEYGDIAKACGVDAILPKPAFAPTVLEAVSKALGTPHTLRAAQLDAQNFVQQRRLLTDKLSRKGLELNIANVALAKAKTELETQVHEQTVELQLANEQLQTKNAKLASMYDLAHQFVENASYELRTPLTVVKQFTAIVRDGLSGPINSEQAEHLDTIGDATDQMATMVNDMLDISRIEAGLLGFRRRRCTVTQIIDYCRAALLRRAAIWRVALEFDIPDNLPEVFCDYEKAGRVVVNLVTNAIRFSKEGSVVSVEALRSSAREGDIVIAVTDHGTGIAPENLAMIWQRFKQVTGQEPNASGSFGLGLSISRELAYMNLGEIGVRSEMGIGSTFYFSIPVNTPRVILERYMHARCASDPKPSGVSFILVKAPSGSGEEVCEDLDALFQALLRRNDFALQFAPSKWLLALVENVTPEEKYRERLEKAIQEANRNRPGRPLPHPTLDARHVWCPDDPTDTVLDGLLPELANLELAHATA